MRYEEPESQTLTVDITEIYAMKQMLTKDITEARRTEQTPTPGSAGRASPKYEERSRQARRTEQTPDAGQH